MLPRLAAVLAVYTLGWAAVAFSIPLEGPDSWLRIFLWMTVPRGLCFVGLLRITRFDFKGLGSRSVFGYAAVMLLLWAVFLTQAEGASWPWEHRLAGISACLVVGLFEETLFRGLVLSRIRESRGDMSAVLWSSVLFTVYHVRPQAVAAWPHIFLTGAVFANLRLKGMSLAQLALIHAAVDSAFFFVGKDAVKAHGPASWIFIAGLYAFAVATFSTIRTSGERTCPS
ncbi:MAG: CPBP family intramembrane glutamic endopeptidase [Elusimicrobiota bacterium]